MNSIDPTPIPVDPAGAPTENRYMSGLLIEEAFRQGWLAARHWPNQPLPDRLDISIQNLVDEVTLRIEW